MATQPALPNNASITLLKALELFEQSFGQPTSELELQARIGAIAAVMELADLDDAIRQVAAQHRQGKRSSESLETAEYAGLETAVHKAKKRLTTAEDDVVLLIRTYLQRVSSRLSAIEFVELAKAAIALCSQDLSGRALAENQYLLQRVLQTFGTNLSQPIPSMGEKPPKPIVKLVNRLARYQKFVQTDGLEATLIDLVTQTLKHNAEPLSRGGVRDALQRSQVAITSNLASQDEPMDDLATVVFFKLQLQQPSAPDIAKQVRDAIAEFKAKYQVPVDITQPRWDNELSVSSPFFTPEKFETARPRFTEPSQNFPDKSSKDETKP